MLLRPRAGPLCSSGNSLGMADGRKKIRETRRRPFTYGLIFSHVKVFLSFAFLAASVFATLCPKDCTRYGTCNEELGRCDCPRHRTGPACQTELNHEALIVRCRELSFTDVRACVSNHTRCLHGCHDRGTCIAGFCHCQPGYFGTDCSLSLGPDGAPQVLADQGYQPRARGPRIYVYELPPALTTWRNEKNLDRPTKQYFWERLIATGVRVGHGDQADWYFLPLTLRNGRDSWFLRTALEYIRETHPWWNRTMGHRHFVIALGDTGREESCRHMSIANNVTFVSYWGLTVDRITSGWRASHRNDTDIVLPVYLGMSKMSHLNILAGRNHPAFAEKAPPSLAERNGPFFFFTGRICGDRLPPHAGKMWPHCTSIKSSGYSGGIRQLVHYYHWNRTGFYVKISDPQYGKHLITSKYCFGPMGGGHGQRQIQAVLAGCVPVVISDGVLEAFEPFLDWNSFGVRVAESDIPRLHEVLGAISEQEYALKVQRLRCAAQHMAFSTVTGAFMGEDGRYDAFETTLEILRAKAAHPSVAPERLRHVDPQLDAFLDCRDTDEGATQGGAGAAGDGKASGYQLCSISPFDHGTQQVSVCPKDLRRNLPHGGMMCGRHPFLGSCPRPWP